MIKPAKDLSAKLAIDFSDANLLEEALTHRSAGVKNGERLEFLGDSILGFVVADEIFSKCPTASEGEMSRLRASLVCKDSLAQIAQHWNIGDYIKLGSGELKSGGFRRASILSDAVEAIIGAYYKDKGFVKAQALIKVLYGERLDTLDTQSISKDAKSRLQEHLQGQALERPEYQVVYEDGPPHARQFKVACTVKSLQLISEGTGSSRRLAEQKAADAMLGLMANEQ